MGLFRKKNRITLDAISATAARAVYQEGGREIPHLEFKFQTKDSDGIHEVIIDMTYDEGSKFIQNAISAHSIIAPPLRMPTFRPIQ